jgi:competence protein ComEA
MKGILRKLGFTAGETAFVIFLILSFAAGVVIKLSGWSRPESFSYSEPDNQFGEKTKQDFEQLKNQPLNDVQKEHSEEIKKIADSLFNESENQTRDNAFKLDKVININTALAADLMLLPGIGEVMAERIIEYREENGRFKKTEDLKKIKGIGEKKFEKIKNYITVE